MIHRIKSFFANVRGYFFARRIEQEINHRIAPHIHGESSHGYEFENGRELTEAGYRGYQDARRMLAAIERQADGMGEATADAFRYIMYRDLNRRLAKYRELMRRRQLPATCNPKFVATRA
jgi:hypothetical protein